MSASVGFLAVAPDLYYWGSRLGCLRAIMRDLGARRGGSFDDLDAVLRGVRCGRSRGPTRHLALIGEIPALSVAAALGGESCPSCARGTTTTAPGRNPEAMGQRYDRADILAVGLMSQITARSQSGERCIVLGANALATAITRHHVLIWASLPRPDPPPAAR